MRDTSVVEPRGEKVESGDMTSKSACLRESWDQSRWWRWWRVGDIREERSESRDRSRDVRVGDSRTNPVGLSLLDDMREGESRDDSREGDSWEKSREKSRVRSRSRSSSRSPSPVLHLPLHLVKLHLLILANLWSQLDGTCSLGVTKRGECFRHKRVVTRDAGQEICHRSAPSESCNKRVNFESRYEICLVAVAAVWAALDS